jgi:hypothetical protein
VYFARRPDGDIWVWSGDLSEGVRQSLWDKIDARPAFAAGVEEDAVCRPATEGLTPNCSERQYQGKF